MKIITENIIIHPFLRWTGSKRWLVKKDIEKFLPKIINNYYEPFLGGGAVFFYLKSKKEYNIGNFSISDSNEELINTYKQLRDNSELVIDSLKKFNNSSDEYYIVRDTIPDLLHDKAARFIYLNRTSFNGIYRVNSNGNYNVPYGKRSNVDIVTSDLLTSIGNILQNVDITSGDFELILKTVKKDDFIFIDPPYTVAHENNGFIMYNQKLFSWDDQIRLKNFIVALSEIGANYILTNAYHSSIVELYSGIGKMTQVSRYSQIGGKNSLRGNYHELIITNIDGL